MPHNFSFTAHQDVDNYNKAIFYLNNFGDTDSKEIINFIINVRADNIIYTAIQQLLKMCENIVINGMLPRTLYQLSQYELYNELKGEVFNIIEKGAFDSLKLDELTKYDFSEEIKIRSV